jgi:Arc/MetJ-type ribon-helix-helix transcriptional regulator
MKTLTIRLPAQLLAQIEAEGRRRGISKSDVVRERLTRAAAENSEQPASFEAILDLIGSVEGCPADLSSRVREHLKATGYGRKRPR